MFPLLSYRLPFPRLVNPPHVSDHWTCVRSEQTKPWRRIFWSTGELNTAYVGSVLTIEVPCAKSRSRLLATQSSTAQRHAAGKTTSNRCLPACFPPRLFQPLLQLLQVLRLLFGLRGVPTIVHQSSGYPPNSTITNPILIQLNGSPNRSTETTLKHIFICPDSRPT